MTEKKLYMLWGVLFILCAALGFIPEPEGLLKALLVLVSILFFVGVLTWHQDAQGLHISAPGIHSDFPVTIRAELM